MITKRVLLSSVTAVVLSLSALAARADEPLSTSVSPCPVQDTSGKACQWFPPDTQENCWTKWTEVFVPTYGWVPVAILTTCTVCGEDVPDWVL